MKRLKIGQVAKKTQVNIETIRFYERKRLITPIDRMESGYRIFSEETVRRILFIKRAKDLGFTLKEILELLSLRVKPSTKCGDIKKKAGKKILAIEGKIALLSRMNQSLVKLTKACQISKPTSQCPILEALDREEN